jgi:5'-nucleotidase
VDLNQPDGSRISNLEMKLKGEPDWVPFDMGRTYTVVTNSFVAAGGDGYFTFEAVVADGRSIDTFLDYANSFIDYIVQDAGGVAAKEPVSEYSTQTFIPLAP